MEILLKTDSSKDTLRAAGRFAVVGMLGTLIDISLFTVLHITLGVPSLLANTISYCAGILNNYFFHRYWTFAGRPRKAVGAQFAQFAVVSLSALALNDLLVLLLSQPAGSLIGDMKYGALLAKICATGVGMVWNFLANHSWTFRGAKGDSK